LKNSRAAEIPNRSFDQLARQLAPLLGRIQLPRIFSLLGDCVLVPEGLDLH
jgi:hypothetical protein